MIGSDCRVRVEGVSFDQYGNILVDVHRLAEIEEYELADIIGSDRTLVARYDLQTCRIVEALPLPVSEAYSIGESRDGILAANYFEDGTMIILYDPQNGGTNYLRGYYPSFSDGGRWLAYYTPNGELMVRSLQDGGEQLLDSGVFFG